MTSRFPVIACVLLSFCLCVPAFGDAHTPHPKVVTLKPGIEALIAHLEEATVTVDSRGLVAAYRVQPFQVHSVLKDGTIRPEARTVDGPNKAGFLLTVSVKASPRYQGPVVLSPDGFGFIRNTYWNTEVREIKLPGGTAHAWVTLARGFDVDEDLMAALHKEIFTHMTAE